VPDSEPHHVAKPTFCALRSRAFSVASARSLNLESRKTQNCHRPDSKPPSCQSSEN
jgi:hypothetical protein